MLNTRWDFDYLDNSYLINTILTRMVAHTAFCFINYNLMVYFGKHNQGALSLKRTFLYLLEDI